MKNILFTFLIASLNWSFAFSHESINDNIIQNNSYIDGSLEDKNALTNALIHHTEDNTFHLFSHGQAGQLFLDNQWLSGDELVAFIQPLIKNKTQLNIYGCHFAQGEKGRNAVSYLETALGISIAASDDLTGIDGDWDLEVGQVVNAISFAEYKANLQSPNCDPTTSLAVSYPQVSTCSAALPTDPVMVITDAPHEVYTSSTFGTSAISVPPAIPNSLGGNGVVNEFMHPDWTVGQMGSIYFTEYGPDGSIYVPASLFTKSDFTGVALQQSGAIGDAFASSSGISDMDGYDVIYKTDPVSGSPSGWALIETNGQGFGGMTYDSSTDSYYVVNLGDLLIYQLDNGGNILSSFSPNVGTSNFVDPDGYYTSVSDFPSRAMGLDISPLDGRLYYSVVRGDRQWQVNSVELSMTGSMSDEMVEFVFDYGPSWLHIDDGEGPPVLMDLEFSVDGKMAIGSMASTNDYFDDDTYYHGVANSMNNHTGLVRVYEDGGAGWSQTVVTSVGQAPYRDEPNATSTGGVAWNQNPSLPEILWMSGGDFNNENSNWGVIGYEFSQLNNIVDQETATNYVQFVFEDNFSGSDPKGNGGDVDIFYCFEPPLSSCMVDADGLANITCIGTNAISLDLNPTGTGIGATYNVSVSGGTATSITPTSGTYGSAQTFTLNDNSVGGGDVTITLTDVDDGTCTRVVTVTDPGTCAPIDPTGYFYCVETGEIIPGGLVTVTPPSGGTVINFDNGADGSYFFDAMGDGTYTIAITAPAGYTIDNTTHQSTAFDPTGMTPPVNIGSDTLNATTMADFTGAANPFYSQVTLTAGEPNIFLNNIALLGCCSSPTVTARDTTICNGNMVDVSTLATTTAGTLTFHNASPPDGSNELSSTMLMPTMNEVVYVLATDATCTAVDTIEITHAIPDSVMICDDASNSATFTAQAGLTNVQWFNSAGTAISGTGDAITVDANTAGMDDGNDSFYYTAQDGSACDIGLCCPIVVETEICSYSLGNQVFADTDNSGDLNGGETGIDGVQLQLLNADGTVYDSDPNTAGDQALTVTTANGGYYRFDGLPAGDYIVEVVASNFTATNTLENLVSSTGTNQEADPDTDGDLNDNGLDTQVSGATRSAVVTLGTPEPTGETETGTYGAGSITGTASADTESNLTVDFGFYPCPTLVLAGTKDPTTCSGTDGEIQLSGLAASTAYTLNYMKDGIAQTALNITSDASGEYVMTSLDAAAYTAINVAAAGCTSNGVAATLNDPSTVTLVLGTTANPTTCSGTDGTIQVTGMTASTAYTLNYMKDGVAQTALSITSDASGNYTMTGLDAAAYTAINVTAAGCTSNDVAQTLNDPSTVTLALGTTANPTTCSGTDGTIQVTGMAASTAYTLNYMKDGVAQTALSITSDASGNYTMTGLDAAAYTAINVTVAGCTSNDVAQTLNDPSTVTLALGTTANPTTCSGTDGTIQVTGMAASTAYTLNYMKDGVAQTALNITSDASGNYTMTGLDAAAYTAINVTAAGCTSNDVAQTLNDPSTVTLALGTTANPTTCSGTDGTIQVTGMAASTAYTLNYMKDGIAQTALNITSDASGEYVMTGLDAAAYTAINITAGGCTSNSVAATLNDPSTVTLALGTTANPTTCSGTDGTIQVTGLAASTAYTLNYMKDGIAQTALNITSDASGEYVMTGLDAAAYTAINITAGGCTSNSVAATLNDPSTVTLALGTTANPTTCSGTDGTIQITGLAASTAYTLNYMKDGIAQTALNITSDASGEYVMTGLDAAAYTAINVTEGGCTSNSVMATLMDPSGVTLGLGTTVNPTTCSGTDGTIQITGMAASTPYVLNFMKDGVAQTAQNIMSDPSGEFVITGLDAAAYTAINVTAAGCTSNDVMATLADPSVPTLAATSSDPTTCGGTDGSISLTLTNVPDGTYVVNYQDETSTAQSFTGVNVSSGMATITGLGEGVYASLTISLNGCTSMEDVNIRLSADCEIDYPDYSTSENPCPDPACHMISNDIYLGSGVTSDSSAGGSTGADTDTDDGVSILPNMQFVTGNTVRIPVSIYNNTGVDANLVMWIDWNGDGDFEDSGEQIESNAYPSTGAENKIFVSVTVPLTAVQSQLIALRARLSTDAVIVLTPCGAGICAGDGEVEDYLLQVDCPSPVCLPVQLQIRRGN